MISIWTLPLRKNIDTYALTTLAFSLSLTDVMRPRDDHDVRDGIADNDDSVDGQ